MSEAKPSLADELSKLKVLMDNGVLTEQEFLDAKAAMLRAIQASAPAVPAPPVTCVGCEGSGKCNRCGGSGEVVVGSRRNPSWLSGGPHSFNEYGTCSLCSGRKNCTSCSGRGTV